MTSALVRSSTGNQFWMRLTEGATRDPRIYDAARSLATDFRSITPATLQATAQKYQLTSVADLAAHVGEVGRERVGALGDGFAVGGVLQGLANPHVLEHRVCGIEQNLTG